MYICWTVSVFFSFQLFIDYNLYGMNLINVAAVKFRRLHKGDGGKSVCLFFLFFYKVVILDFDLQAFTLVSSAL